MIHLFKKLPGISFLFLIFFSASPVLLPADILLNQAGYGISLPKYFYYTANADSFFIIEQSSQTIYFRGTFQFITNYDPATGLTIYKGDFSSLNRQGVYYIKTSSNDQSGSFPVSYDFYEDSFQKSLKAFYYQRCGTSLLFPNAGVYYRASCHTLDGIFHPSTGLSGFHPSPKGWHDAGDYGKYIVNAGISAGTLLMAYEKFPEKFNADDLNIPESGNGVPDILDEVKYEIMWMLAMQDNNGGIYFKLTPEQFESFVMPAQATASRYIYQLSSTATGDFIAVLSRFARLYKQYDSSFAAQCLNAAINAWNYLSAQTGIVPPGGFHNPPGTATGEYGDGNDSDERLWASAELYETTGNQEYKDYYDFNYNLNGIINSTMWWGNVRILAQITYLNSKQSSASTTVKTDIRNSLANYCNGLLARNSSNSMGVTLNPGEYTWGSNSSVLNNAIILVYGFTETGNINYRNAAVDQLNYIFGTNGTKYCFVTGTGIKRVMHPHHRPSEADGISEPIPGLLAGGPDQYLDDPVLQNNFNSSTPPALCYIDNVGSYASNEIAINWNAPLVFLTGYFNNFDITSVDDKNETGSLNEFRLYQNYPNPFNSTTKINFTLPQNGFTSLKIYDSIGSEVKTLLNGDLQPGNYEIKFDAGELAGGVYYCQLKSGAALQTRKIVLLK